MNVHKNKKITDDTTIIFLRAPEKGKVKTRLAISMDTEQVLNLYKGFIHDTISASDPVSRIILYCWPPEKAQSIADWLKNKFYVFPQSGDNIGSKMANAFQELFDSGVKKAILIGTDIPDISQTIITQAFNELNRNDIVLAPAQDGGYYLIGFNNNTYYPAVFEGINWSTPIVLQETISIMKKNNYRYYLLPELNDIDTLEDLNNLVKRYRNGHKTGNNTADNLIKYKL